MRRAAFAPGINAARARPGLLIEVEAVAAIAP